MPAKQASEKALLKATVNASKTTLTGLINALEGRGLQVVPCSLTRLFSFQAFSADIVAANGLLQNGNGDENGGRRPYLRVTVTIKTYDSPQDKELAAAVCTCITACCLGFLLSARANKLANIPKLMYLQEN